MAKNIVLFGAGASFGSDKFETPPLGANLFEALTEFNPDGWGAIDQDTAEKFKNDFEKSMKFLEDHSLPLLQKAMADYFFRFVPRSGNLYLKFARRIPHGWDGAFITLNYERLLELSLIQAGFQPIIGKPEKELQIELCFPHGCCHFFCESVMAQAAHVSFSGRNVRTYANDRIKVVSNPAEFSHRIKNDAFPPIMSYFDPEKMTTSGADFIDQQRNRCDDLIRNAERVTLVGIKVRPHDKHIWRSLAETDAEIIYCSGPNDSDSFDSWIKSERPSKKNLDLCGYFLDKFGNLSESLGS